MGNRQATRVTTPERRTASTTSGDWLNPKTLELELPSPKAAAPADGCQPSGCGASNFWRTSSATPGFPAASISLAKRWAVKARTGLSA